MLYDWSGSAIYMKKYVGLGPPTHLPLKSSTGRAVPVAGHTGDIQVAGHNNPVTQLEYTTAD